MRSLGKLEDSFRQGLALPRSFDVTTAESTNLRQWDSVAHLQLVIAIEDTFGIQLTPAEVIDLNSFNAAATMLQRRGIWADE